MRKCEVVGCWQKHVAKGFCSTHYTQAAKGRPIVPARRLQPAAKLGLEELVARRSIPCPETGCYLWLGSDKNGYASVRFGRRMERVSRLLLGLKQGDKLEACHRCDVPLCVNLAHLYAGTRTQNIMDAVRRGRWTQRGPAPKAARP